MNWKLSLIYTISILLLCIYGTDNRYIPKKTRKLVIAVPKEFRQQPKELRNLYRAYIYGTKFKVSKIDKKAHKTLNLYHLFTPSGLHFSLFYVLINLFFRLPYIQKLRRLKIGAFLLLSISPFFITDYYSLKRISSLKLGLKIKNWYFPNYTYYFLFLIIFSLDFLLGTFSFSPLSYIFSFLFLGIIFSMAERSQALWPWAFLGGQLIISYFFNDYQTHIGFFLGYLLTLLFPLVLLFLIGATLFPSVLSSLSFSLLELYRVSIIFCADLSSASGALWPSLPLILCFILPKKRAVLLTLLLIHSPICF